MPTTVPGEYFARLQTINPGAMKHAYAQTGEFGARGFPSLSGRERVWLDRRRAHVAPPAGCVPGGGRELRRYRRQLFDLGAWTQGRRIGERDRKLAEEPQEP